MSLGPLSSVSKINYKILTSLGALASTTSVASTSVVNNYQTLSSDVKTYYVSVEEFIKKHFAIEIDLNEIKNKWKTYYESFESKIKEYFDIPSMEEVKSFGNSFGTYLSYIQTPFQYLFDYLSKTQVESILGYLKQFTSFLPGIADFLKSINIQETFHMMFNLVLDSSFWEFFSSLVSTVSEGTIPWTELKSEDWEKILAVFNQANKDGKLHDVIQKFTNLLQQVPKPFNKKLFLFLIDGNIRDKLKDMSVGQMITAFLEGKTLIFEKISEDPIKYAIEAVDVATEMAIDKGKEFIEDPVKTTVDTIGSGIKGSIDAAKSLMSWWFSS